jgi:hypothetical protein
MWNQFQIDGLCMCNFKYEIQFLWFFSLYSILHNKNAQEMKLVLRKYFANMVDITYQAYLS